MNKLKIGIVGVGSISRSHIKAYLANPDVELYAFCDINAERLALMGETYNITRLYTDEAQMLRELPELDAVSVCTWNSAHAPCTIMALNAGKHVLCEKPMATNVADALAMKEAAERNGKLLMIGFVRRFGRDCRTVENLIRGNRLGEVYYAKALNLRRNGNPGGWFANKALSGGGPLIDLGVHSIDLVRYLLGKPRATSVFGATFQKLGNRSHIIGKKSYRSSTEGMPEICDCEDLASAMIRFEDGSTLSVEMSFALNIGSHENHIQLFGTNGGVKIGDRVSLFSEADGYLTNIELDAPTGLDFDGCFVDEIQNFSDSILGKASCRATAEDGIELMRILCAIYRSAETGHEEVIER